MNANTRHGHAKKFDLSPEYRAWLGMKARCYNSNELKYKDYGARGIIVCQRWLAAFENFLADVGLRPSSNHSLGRKENDGNYCPENCRWETPTEQANNRRSKSMNQDSRTRVLGVAWVATRGCYRAHAYRQGKSFSLYYGKDFFEACCARKSWEAAQRRTETVL